MTVGVTTYTVQLILYRCKLCVVDVRGEHGGLTTPVRHRATIDHNSCVRCLESSTLPRSLYEQSSTKCSANIFCRRSRSSHWHGSHLTPPSLYSTREASSPHPHPPVPRILDPFPKLGPMFGQLAGRGCTGLCAGEGAVARDRSR